jgi:hypothetical protein
MHWTGAQNKRRLAGFFPALHRAQPNSQAAQCQNDNCGIERATHRHQNELEGFFGELRNGCEDFLQIHDLSLIERLQK